VQARCCHKGTARTDKIREDKIIYIYIYTTLLEVREHGASKNKGSFIQMTQMHAINEINLLNQLVDVYINTFEKHFGNKPIVDDFDKSALRRVIGNTRGVEPKELERLVRGYFELQNDFIKSNGFKLQFFEKSFNAVVAQQGAVTVHKPDYVVSLTQDGIPLLSKNPKEMGEGYSFKPILHDEWKKQND